MRLLLASCFVLAPLKGLSGEPDRLAAQIEQARADRDALAEVELLRRWIAVHPGDQGALQKLAALWLQVQDFGMAAGALRDVADPGFVARARAEILWRQDENLNGALDLLRARASEAPADRDSCLMLSKYLAIGKLYQELVAVLDSLIKERANSELYLDRAAARIGSDDPEGALADFRRAAAEDPDGQPVQARRAAFDRLEKSLEAIGGMAKQPDSPALSFRRAYWWLYGGVPERALASARSGLAAWPGSACGNILECRSLFATGAMDASKALTERRVMVSGPLESFDVFKGLLLADAAFAANPDEEKARLDQAAWLSVAGQYLLASDAVESVLKTSPSSIPAIHLAVAINRRLGNMPAATAYAARLSELKAPKAVLSDVFTGLAEMAFEQSNFTLALDFVSRALAAQSTQAAWKLKAACHTRLGQPNEAASALKSAEKR